MALNRIYIPYHLTLLYTTICSWKSLLMFILLYTTCIWQLDVVWHKSDYCNLNNPAQRLRDGAEFYLDKTRNPRAENGILKDFLSICMMHWKAYRRWRLHACTICCELVIKGKLLSWSSNMMMCVFIGSRLKDNLRKLLELPKYTCIKCHDNNLCTINDNCAGRAKRSVTSCLWCTHMYFSLIVMEHSAYKYCDLFHSVRCILMFANINPFIIDNYISST